MRGVYVTSKLNVWELEGGRSLLLLHPDASIRSQKKLIEGFSRWKATSIRWSPLASSLGSRRGRDGEDEGESGGVVWRGTASEGEVVWRGGERTTPPSLMLNKFNCA